MGPFRRLEHHAAQMTGRLRWLGLVLLATLPGATPWSHAQDQALGSPAGVVRDAQGRSRNDCTLLLQSIEGPADERHTTATDSRGNFSFPNLGAGPCQLSIAKPPSASQPTPVEIPPGDAFALSLQLSANGGPPSVQTTAEPTSDITPLPDENGDGLIGARGLEPMQSSAVADGISLVQNEGGVPVGTGTDPAPDPDGDPDSAERTSGPSGGLARGRHAGIAYLFSQSSIREFRVAGRSYSAQRGHADDVSTTITRGGSATLHGSAFLRVRSQLFAAHDPSAYASSFLDGAVTFVAVKPHDLTESFGGAVGGPVPRIPHTFFFYSLDLQRRGFPAISSPADPNFYRLTSTQTALLENRGVTAPARNAALNYLSSLTGPTDRRADQTIHFGRLDWTPRPGLSAALEYNRARWNSPAGLMNAPVVPRGRASLGNAAGSLDLILLRVKMFGGAHTDNLLRVAFIRDLQYETPQTPLPQEPAIGGNGLAPEINIGPNGLLFGTPAGLSRRAYPDERRLQASDTLTRAWGRNMVSAGAEVSFISERVATLANSAGTFRYDSGFTNGKAGGLVDFITDYTFSADAAFSGGCPSIFAPTHLFCFRSFTQSFGEDAVVFSTQDWAGFVEDSWHPRPGLSLQVGARYEYTFLPLPQLPNPSLDAVFGRRGASSVFPEDRNNAGPRAGVAWQPFGPGKGVVRAGFGVFFGRIPGATIRTALSDTAQVAATTRVRIRPTAEVACPQVPASGFGYACSFLSQPPGVVASTTSAVVFDRRFRLPMVQQGSLSLERELPRRTTVALSYVFNLDRQLASSTDLNIAPSASVGLFQLQGGTGRPGVRDGEVFQVPLYAGRLTPGFGPVSDIVSDVNASYNGLTLAGHTHPAETLRLQADLTWSKALDFGQAQSATPRTSGRFDPFTNGYDKALSALNYPLSFHAEAVWLPAWRGLRGVALRPLVVARSGRPYSLDLSGGPSLPGGHQSINGSGGAQYLPTVGRNTLRLPAVVHADLQVSRTFHVGPHLQVQAAAETFNLLNHRVVSSVQQRAFLVGKPVDGITPLVFQDANAIAAEGLQTQPFGTQTAAGTDVARERQVQFSLHLAF